MSQHYPETPPTVRSPPWQARAQAQQRASSHIVAACLAGLLALSLLAAWAIPPALDWGRYRTGIASIAAAQLGRPVVIAGDVTLRLLPEAVLTATNVTLPDQGDGVSATLGTLRLQVALLPLMAGRIVPRDLVLGSPILLLPWPLPDRLVHPTRPTLAHAFAAHIEGGTLRIGPAQITGINAGIHAGPAPAAQPSTLVAGALGSGFGADGFAAFAGRSWRFTGALGIPDADGVSALDLAVAGQGAAARTDAVLQGTLADSVVQGRVHAGGPDLSLLMPAAPLAWHLDAPFTASGERIEAASVAISLGGSPAEASLNLHVAPLRLDGRVHAAALDLDSWIGVLRATASGGPNAGPTMSLPGRLELTAGTAQLFGGALSGLHGMLVSDGRALRLEQASVVLPGRATLEIDGLVGRGEGSLGITGPSRLDASDLHATLRWLRGLAPALVDALPRTALRSGTISGLLDVGAGHLSVSGMSGQIDGVGVTGGFGVGLGVRTSIGAGLQFDTLALDEWFDAVWKPGGMAAAVRGWSPVDGDLHLQARAGVWHGLALDRLAADVRTSAAGIALTRASTGVAGAVLRASGAIRPDSSLSSGAVFAQTGDAAVFVAALPPAWRTVPGLWRGPASVEATLSGPPGTLAVQVRADVGDLVAEAELRGDVAAGTADGSMTLRHPGAPRLLAMLGVSGAEQWLHTGSVAVRAGFTARPGHLGFQDLDVAAADFRATGNLDLDLTGQETLLHGAVAAETLALPGLAQIAEWRPDWLRGWSVDLKLSADQVNLGGVPAVQAMQAGLALASGIGLLDIASASLAGGGTFAGQAAADAGQTPPVVAVHGQWAGVHLQGPVTGWPVDLTAGDVNATLDGSLSGPQLRLDHLTGTGTLALRNATLAGMSIADAGTAAVLRGSASRAALRTALSQGTSTGLAGTISVDANNGQIRVAPATLVSDAGIVTAQGKFDQTGVDLSLTMTPTNANTLVAKLQEAGTWSKVTATAEIPQPPNPKKRGSGASGPSGSRAAPRPSHPSH